MLSPTKTLVEKMILKNSWKKSALILEPNPEIWWMNHYCGPTYADVLDNWIDLYAVGRDVSGVSRVGVVRLDKTDPSKVLSIGEEPVLDDVRVCESFEEFRVPGQQRKFKSGQYAMTNTYIKRQGD